MQVAELPHTSVALYVLESVYWFAQTWFVMISFTQVMVAAPPQLSVAVTPAVLTAGTSPAQATVRFAGQVKVGGTLSNTVMV